VLRDIIERTAYAVSNDDLRPAMMGVLFQWKGDDFICVSTDGHRLVRIRYAGAAATEAMRGARDVIIPAKALTLVQKSLHEGEVGMVFGRSHVRFSFSDMQLLSRIIDERYPNYESVIPLENDKHLVVHRAALHAAVQRCAIFSNALTNQVRFTIGKEETRVSAEDMDFGGEARETLPSSFTGDEELEIGFNARYVADALAHIDAEEVEFLFSSPTRAGLVKPRTQPTDTDLLMLVMPLRLNA